MIFVTVGTQLPFDRLIRAVDTWAGTHNRTDIFAQIGPSKFRPAHLQFRDFIDAQEFRTRVHDADIVIAHAGMGSIITALELGKTILVMPRRASLGEHRNEHQLATAQRFLAQGRIQVAFDENELVTRLSSLNPARAANSGSVSPHASPELLSALREFVSSPR